MLWHKRSPTVLLTVSALLALTFNLMFHQNADPSLYDYQYHLENSMEAAQETAFDAIIQNDETDPAVSVGNRNLRRMESTKEKFSHLVDESQKSLEKSTKAAQHTSVDAIVQNDKKFSKVLSENRIAQPLQSVKGEEKSVKAAKDLALDPIVQSSKKKITVSLNKRKHKPLIYRKGRRSKLVEWLDISPEIKGQKCDNLKYWDEFSTRLFDKCWLSPSDKTTALLVSDATFMYRSAISWQTAQSLESQHPGFRHSYLEKPVIRSLSMSEVKYWSPEDLYRKFKWKLEHEDKRQVVVQKVMNKLGTWDFSFRNEKMCSEFETFWEGVEDPSVFSKNLLSDLEFLAILLQKERWLVDDFSVMVDATGKLYHTNLDRPKKSQEQIFLWQEQYETILSTLRHLANHHQLTDDVREYSCQAAPLGYDGNTINTTGTNMDFSWDMLSSLKPGQCGYHKCFFMDRANPEHGYSIMVDDVSWDYMKKSWDRIREMKKNHPRLNHIYLSAPQNHAVNDQMMELFHSAIKNASHDGRSDSNDSTAIGASISAQDLVLASKSSSPKTSTVIIQKVLFVNPVMEVGRRARHKEVALKKWPEFKKKIPNEVLWHNRLLGQLPLFEEVIHSQTYLRYDYQLMIDRLGRIIHFDLDRIVEKKGRMINPEPFIRDLELVGEMRLEDTSMKQKSY